jgi:hypothetical protein
VHQGDTSFITLRITGLVDFAQLPEFKVTRENTTFRKLDMCASSGEGGGGGGGECGSDRWR